jgi:hypothetical protein
LNFELHVTSAGYNALCAPSAFIATNGNLTISSGANVYVGQGFLKPLLILFETFS